MEQLFASVKCFYSVKISKKPQIAYFGHLGGTSWNERSGWKPFQSPQIHSRCKLLQRGMQSGAPTIPQFPTAPPPPHSPNTTPLNSTHSFQTLLHDNPTPHISPHTPAWTGAMYFTSRFLLWTKFLAILFLHFQHLASYGGGGTQKQTISTFSGQLRPSIILCARVFDLGRCRTSCAGTHSQCGQRQQTKSNVVVGKHTSL